MTDNRDGRELSPQAANEIPPVPRWEEAYRDYAVNNAPDLMPRILAKINRTIPAETAVTKETEPTKTIVPTAEHSPAKPKTEGRMTRFVVQYLPKIVALSGAVAAVIILGLLIILPGIEKKKAGDERVSATPAQSVTVAAADSSQFEDNSPAPTGEGKASSVPGGQDSVPQDEKDPEIRDNDQVSNDPLSLYGKPVYRYLARIEQYATTTDMLGVAHSNEPATVYTMEVTIGDPVSTDQGTVYFTEKDNGITDIVIRWDKAETGKTVKLKLEPAGTIEIESLTFGLFDVISVVK